MKNEKTILFILAIIQFTHIMDFMIIMPLGKQLMEEFSISPKQFSLIVSSYAITAFFAGLVSASYIDRFDRKKALISLYLGFTLSTIVTAQANSYYLLLTARALTGCFGGILSAMVLSIVADIIPLERRGAAMGIIMTAFSVASVVGVPTGIFLAAKFNWHAPFWTIGTLSACICLFAFYTLPTMTKHLEGNFQKQKPWQVFTQIFSDRNQLNALIFTFVLMLGHFMIIPFIAPYMQFNIGFTDYQVLYIYLIGGLFTAVLLPIVGKISDRMGHAKVFTFASFFALGSIFLITNLPPVTLIIALCATSSFFIVSSGRNVPATTMVTSVVKPENRASFMSIRSSANELALGVSSLIAGFIVIEQEDKTLANFEYVGYIAIVMSILAVILARRLKLKS